MDTAALNERDLLYTPLYSPGCFRAGRIGKHSAFKYSYSNSSRENTSQNDKFT